MLEFLPGSNLPAHLGDRYLTSSSAGPAGVANEHFPGGGWVFCLDHQEFRST